MKKLKFILYIFAIILFACESIYFLLKSNIGNSIGFACCSIAWIVITIREYKKS